jgi:Tfp pilus assembly protein PilF
MYIFKNLLQNKKQKLMRKAIQAVLIICLFFCQAQAQNTELEKHVAKGVDLHDKGDYSAAIREYEKALKIDAGSPLAHSEMATTYFAMKQYDKSIEHCDKVIEAGTRYVDNAYVTKGSALDMQGKPQEAIKAYQKGIKNNPKNHFLHYNLALTSFNIKEYDQAEKALEKSLRLNPAHASSHLLMAYVMREKEDRVKALLAIYNFRMLEPPGDRAKTALSVADKLMKNGVVREDPKHTSIFMSGPKTDTSDHFSAANFMLSILEAGKDVDKTKKRSDAEVFMGNSKAFLSLLGTLRKNDTGFWWDYYVDFYSALMTDKDRAEAFGYLISVSWDDKDVTAWVKKNKSKMDELGKWYDDYKRK